jgi:UDP-glucuronate 4-epimerase
VHVIGVLSNRDQEGRPMFDARTDSRGRALVTGVAGFIGSSLAERLVDEGVDVVGVDAFTDYYDPAIKWRNIERLRRSPGFTLHSGDLRTIDLEPLLDGVDVVYHQAGQPGVRLSWADGFGRYSRLNIEVTQRLLDAVRERSIARFVFASSSSIYGLAESFPTDESVVPRPFSPYGVTKYAAELLCGAYAANYGVPTVALRYFTVYGQRQRPDMAIHRLIECARKGSPFPMLGTGDQIRDFTHVSDVVDASVRAGSADVPIGSCFNIAGGASVCLVDLIETVSELAGQPIRLERCPSAPGDVHQTAASIDAARELLGWKPEVGLRDGLAAQISWHKENIT